MRKLIAMTVVAALALAACSSDDPAPGERGTSTTPPTPPATTSEKPTSAPASSDAPTTEDAATEDAGTGEAVAEFEVIEHERFSEGWALEFLPGTDHLLINERGGTMKLRNQSTGEITEVQGAPEVYHAGQAGLHDVIAAPSFETDGKVVVSWVTNSDDGPRGVVATGTLDVASATLSDLSEIWRQDATSGDGHFSLRMVIHDDHLFLTSGDRQKFQPAQDHGTNLGKVLRLSLDGTPALENPFGNEGVESSFWTIGHRNPLGIAVDVDGNLWSSEMGPKGGDELNLITPGENYGWPEASMGVHYDGKDIPDHADGDGFKAPAAYWVPAISPGNLEIYTGDLFTGWRNSALLGGLSGKTLVRVALDGETAEVVAEWDMGERIREVEEAPDGSIGLLEDGDGGRLLELRPA